MERSLEQAVRDLKTCAGLVGVRVKKAREGDLPPGTLACWSPEGNKILMGKWAEKKPTVKVVYILAHELGHALDAMTLRPAELEWCIDAFQLFNTCLRLGVEAPRELKPFILAKEDIAFSLGERVLKSIDARLPERLMKVYRKRSLDGYRKMMRG